MSLKLKILLFVFTCFLSVILLTGCDCNGDEPYRVGKSVILLERFRINGCESFILLDTKTKTRILYYKEAMVILPKEQ